MKHKNMTAMLVFIIIALAFASSAAAENITYTYKTGSGSVITTNHTHDLSQLNVTLPNTTWTLELSDTDGKFGVSVADINVTAYPDLDIRAVPVDLNTQTYDGSVGRTSGSFRYIARYAYALNVSRMSNKAYTITFDYSNIVGVSDPVIWKCNFSFVTNTTSTSECAQLSTSASNNVASASATGFSAFFLTDDECAGTCGGICPSCGSSPGSSGGGGGGGGGGGRGPTTIYVTPTSEGASAQVYAGDTIIITYKDEKYTYKVESVEYMNVGLESKTTSLVTEIEMGELKDMNIPSLFNQEVQVSMHISNRFAVLTFRIKEKKPFSFPLLPPRPQEATPSQASTPTGAATPIEVVTPTAPASPGAAVAETPEIPVPESPIGIWTIIFALIFVMFLVGGVALYRVRLHRLEKPPTVTRTGLETTGLPETSSKVSKPAPSIKPVVGPKRDVHLTQEKKLDLEKYIFHAYSLGFKEDQVRQALIAKGWPEPTVKRVMKEIKPK
ncbi:hypothetical protein ACFL3V_01580 [Nanoarchaeota archaeon]